jgi:hypothetical protein
MGMEWWMPKTKAELEKMKINPYSIMLNTREAIKIIPFGTARLGNPGFEADELQILEYKDPLSNKA